MQVQTKLITETALNFSHIFAEIVTINVPTRRLSRGLRKGR